MIYLVVLLEPFVLDQLECYEEYVVLREKKRKQPAYAMIVE